MKTSYGRITLFAFLLLAGAMLFMPMRAGEEDSLIIQPDILKMNPGDRYQVRCGLSSDDLDQRITFATSDDRVAAINPDGTVYAITSGEAVITARASGGAAAQAQVIVAGTPMRQLALNTDELHIQKGEISGLSVTYDPDATDTRLQWVSADESIAKVSANGRILGVGGGRTTVSVLTPGGASASADVVVEVDSTAAYITPNDLTIGVGAQVPLHVHYLPLDSTDSVRGWSSSDASIAYVDADGVLHAVRTGKAYINLITQDGISTSMEVTVEKAPRDLQLSPARATIERGEQMDLQVLYLNAAGQVEADMKHLVIWESSNPDVASVDQNGRVTALRGGMTRITASSDGHTAQCQLRVAVTVKTLTLDAHEMTLLKEQTGEAIYLHYSIDPSDADDPAVYFASDNTQVAQVSADGVVTLTGGYGTAVITAWNASGAMDTFTVNVVVALPEETDDADPMDEFADNMQIADGQDSDPNPESGASGTATFGSGAGTFGDGGAAPSGGTGEAGIYDGENIYD